MILFGTAALEIPFMSLQSLQKLVKTKQQIKTSHHDHKVVGRSRTNDYMAEKNLSKTKSMHFPVLFHLTE